MCRPRKGTLELRAASTTRASRRAPRMPTATPFASGSASAPLTAPPQTDVVRAICESRPLDVLPKLPLPWLRCPTRLRPTPRLSLRVSRVAMLQTSACTSCLRWGQLALERGASRTREGHPRQGHRQQCPPWHAAQDPRRRAAAVHARDRRRAHRTQSREWTCASPSCTGPSVRSSSRAASWSTTRSPAFSRARVATSS